MPRFRSSVAWAIAIQLLSSASNLVLFIWVARLSEPAALGAFSVVFTVQGFGVGFARAAIGDAYVLEVGRGGWDAAERAATQRPLTKFVVLSLLGTGFVMGIGTAVKPEYIQIYLAMAVVQPLIYYVEFLRYSNLAVNNFKRAALIDAAWLSLTVIAAAIGSTVNLGAAAAILCWGIAALIGARCIAARDKARSNRLDLRSLRASHQEVAFGADYALAAGGGFVALTMLAPLLPSSEFAALRSALLVFSFAATVLATVRILYLRWLGRHSAASPRTILVGCAYGMTVTVAIGLIAVVAVSVPTGVGQQVLGRTWSDAADLFLLVATLEAIRGWVTPAVDHARAFSSPQVLVTARSLSAVLVPALALAGGGLAGVRGALLGFIVAQLVAAIGWWGLVLSSFSSER